MPDHRLYLRRGASRLLLFSRALVILGHLAYAAGQLTFPWDALARGTLTAGMAIRLALLLGLAVVDGLLFYPEARARFWPRWERLRGRLPSRLRSVLAGAGLLTYAIFVLWRPLPRLLAAQYGWKTVPEWVQTPWLWAAPVAVLWLGLWLWPTPRPDAETVWATVLAVTFALAWLDPYTQVSAYPFSQTWSEGNRLWDYSIPFGRARYLYPPERPIPVLGDWGRLTLGGLPYLWPDAGLLTLRLWLAVLVTVPYVWLAAVALRRARLPYRRWLWLPMWGYLFLHQGPIYTPLVLSALLVVWAWRQTHRLVAAGLVALAGFYAQETRYTWMFAPAIWAALLSMGDWPNTSRPPRSAWQRTLILTLAGVVGGVLLPLALGRPQALHLLPNQAQAALTKHPLLWKRLWPNATFSLGLLPGILLAVGPALGFLGWSARQGWWRVHPWAKSAWLGGLLAFATVGTLVSVKSGGGNNLHNYDMLFLAVLLGAGLAWERGLRAAYARGAFGQGRARVWLALLVLVPSFLAAYTLQPQPFYPPQAEQVLQRLRRAVRAAATEGEVLFIDQRQLLTFGLVDPIPLVPEYEKKRLMNEAMAGNRAYFAAYYRDLAAHRFRLIVSEPLKPFAHQADAHNFAEEHNAWTYWVARPTLCFYRPLFTDWEVGVQLLVPRPQSDDCRPYVPVALPTTAGAAEP